MKLFLNAALILAASLVCQSTFAQAKPAPKISYFPSQFEPVMKADLDTSGDVSRYSLAQAKELLAKLYEADQRYRRLHARYWQERKVDTDSARYYAKRFMANDAANQVLFTKILQKFGWPTISKFGRDLSEKAWFIAWHGDDRYQAFVFPYLKKAYEAHDVLPEHYLSIKRKIDAVTAFSSR